MPKSKRKRLKEVAANNSKRLIAEDIPNYNKMAPVFSLERVQPGDFCFSSLGTNDKAAFADSIFKRRRLTWEEIQKQHRHKSGHEIIDRASLEVQIPRFITEDEQKFLSFRFSGMKPMVGYRVNNISYVLWFDHSFKLYDHG